MPLPCTIDLLWEDDIISQSLYLRFRWTRDQILFQLDHYEWDNPIGRKWFKMEFMSSVSNLKRWGVDDLASEFKPERFLADKAIRDSNTIAFGWGRRIFPGIFLAENR